MIYEFKYSYTLEETVFINLFFSSSLTKSTTIYTYHTVILGAIGSSSHL